MPAPSGKVGVVWVKNPIPDRLKVANPSLRQVVWRIIQYEATDAQNMMRRDAKWKDRTGNARQGLFTKPSRLDQGYLVVLYHTMPYGIWLEVRHSGELAIVRPSVPVVGNQIMNSLRKAMKNMGIAA